MSHFKVSKINCFMYTMEDGHLEQGLSSLWTSVNHVAIVVSDVGRSLAFYADILGMKQVMRPNFDR